jgi:hypothetical protein
VTREQYVACSRRLGTTVPATVRAVSSRREGNVALVVIRMRSRLSRLGATLRIHVYAVDGRWRWILAKHFREQLARRRCLDGSPLDGGPPV